LDPLSFSNCRSDCSTLNAYFFAIFFVPDAGSDPIWDENFTFQIDSEVTEITIKLFDKDTFSADDPLGTAMYVNHECIIF
jgi:hypothetical protein